MKIFLNEDNQIHNFTSSSGSGTVISYGSGSTSRKLTVPTVPVPQHWVQGPLFCNKQRKNILADILAASWVDRSKSLETGRAFSAKNDSMESLAVTSVDTGKVEVSTVFRIHDICVDPDPDLRINA